MDLRGDYEPKYTCPNCKRQFKRRVDLDQHFWCLTPSQLERAIKAYGGSYKIKKVTKKPSPS